jgi:hypothetical protein
MDLIDRIDLMNWNPFASLSLASARRQPAAGDCRVPRAIKPPLAPGLDLYLQHTILKINFSK